MFEQLDYGDDDDNDHDDGNDYDEDYSKACDDESIKKTLTIMTMMMTEGDIGESKGVQERITITTS